MQRRNVYYHVIDYATWLRERANLLKHDSKEVEASNPIEAAWLLANAKDYAKRADEMVRQYNEICNEPLKPTWFQKLVLWIRNGLNI
jgi:hypothetical protein